MLTARLPDGSRAVEGILTGKPAVFSEIGNYSVFNPDGKKNQK